MLGGEIETRASIIAFSYLGRNIPFLPLSGKQLSQSLLAFTVGRGRINEIDPERIGRCEKIL